jgi:ATP-dependent DNA ligase
MSEELPNYVRENHAKTSSLDLSSWLRDNPPPVICEPKYDGMRIFLFKSGEHLVVSGRIGTVFTPSTTPKVFARVPELVRAPNRIILDGVYVAKDGLHLFDILQVDDRDLRPLPLYRRKEMLHEVILNSGLESPFVWAETEEEIQRFAGEQLSNGIDGIIVKNRNSFYGEKDAWMKIQRLDTADCFVIDMQGNSRSKKLWSLGVYDASGKIVNLGEVASFGERVDPKKVRLGSVVEVRYELVDGKFLAQFLLKVRRDKLASECTLSQIPRLERLLTP